MNLFSTLIQRVTALVVVLVMVLSVNAEERIFATIAEMNKDTTLSVGEKVTITNDVVVEYVFESYFIIKDKDDSTTCLNYNYSFNEFQRLRGSVVEEYPELAPLKGGDVFKGYSATVYSISDGAIMLEPELDNDNLVFIGCTEEKTAETDYAPIIIKTSIKELLETPEAFYNKLVSLDNATTINKGFNAYLAQGTDTLTNFRISGLNSEDYPNNIVINRALCTKSPRGGAKLELGFGDYEVGAFTDLKSLKAAKSLDSIEYDLTVKVLKTEEYEGKTYITVMMGEGKHLINFSGIRICVDSLNDIDKDLKLGQVINIKGENAKLTPSKEELGRFMPSLLTIGKHETVILKNEAIKYIAIGVDEITMYAYYEFLPMTLSGYLTLTDNATDEEKSHNVSSANFSTEYGDVMNVLVDTTVMPENVSTDKFVLSGILDFPLWKEKTIVPFISPLLAENFLNLVNEYDNIAALVEAGAPNNPMVQCKVNSEMTITGIEFIAAVGSEDQPQNVAFVTDETGSLTLNSSMVGYKVGDVISALVGRYHDAVATQQTEYGLNFGVGNRFSVDTIETKLDKTIDVEPIDVTIAQLLADDSYAAKVVRLSDFTYNVVVEVVQDVTVERHFIYQGTDSMAVSKTFVEQENKEELVGNYYLNGFYTQLLPIYSKEEGNDLENVVADANIFIKDNTIYANSAVVEVYDVMGRMIVKGENSVSIANTDQMIFVVKTIYADGSVFVTKLAKR